VFDVRTFQSEVSGACFVERDIIVSTGQSDSSITWADTFRGPGRIAVDPTADRFAYSDGARVVVIEKN